MRGTIGIRIVLCGSVAGIVWFLFSVAFLSSFSQDFLSSVDRAALLPPRGGVFFFGLDIMMGIWAMWLYSAIATGYGAGSKTAVIAGIAWWTIKSLQSAKWAGLGLVPSRMIVLPLVKTLIAAVLASVAGAFLYDRVQ